MIKIKIKMKNLSAKNAFIAKLAHSDIKYNCGRFFIYIELDEDDENLELSIFDLAMQHKEDLRFYSSVCQKSYGLNEWIAD